jgi:hypothetical protein
MVVRVFVAVAAIVEATATVEICDAGDRSCFADDASAMQTHKQSKSKVHSQMDRVVKAIRSAPQDAETICVQAEVGDEAPAEGTFLVDGKVSTVQQGFVAQGPGQYCMPKQSLLLIQRANGFADGASFERALMGKTPTWKNDDVFRGKRLPRKCEEIPNMCKMSLAPIKSKFCPILWSIPNSVLKNLPGCTPEDAALPGVEARRNIEGACMRSLRLHWQCPLKCQDVMDFAKDEQPDFKEKYACWAPLDGAGACNNAVLSNSIDAMLKARVNEVKSSLGSFGWVVSSNVNPCSEEKVAEICEPHCPLTCETVFDGSIKVANESHSGNSSPKAAICHVDANPNCNAAAVATALNDELKEASQPIRETFQMEGEANGKPCDEAKVTAICNESCTI